VSCLRCLLICGPPKLRVRMWSCMYLGGSTLLVAMHVVHFLGYYIRGTCILHDV